MFETPKEKEEKAKVLRKLMRQWLLTQGTKCKVDVLLSKNPELKQRKTAAVRKDI
jgi:hypothetical protein